jgi:iron(III) transport system substrate-binding protein
VVALALAIVIAACGPAPAAPTAPGAVAGAPSGAAPPAPSGQEALDTAAWEQTVAAAKREGKVVVLGPTGVEAREALTESFQRRYPEIAVEFSGGSGAQTAPKVLAERQAGHFLSDIHIGGTTTMLSSLKPAGVLDPIQPYLVGPESKDLSKWLDGRFDYADNDAKYNLVFNRTLKASIAYNPRLVTPADLSTHRNLADPKWQGKIAMRDPRSAGPGLAFVTFLYTTPSLGPEFVRQLLGTRLAYTGDARQLLDWVARGQYPIGLGIGEVETVELIRKGLPLALLDSQQIEEGSYVTAGFGSVVVMNRAPHPNATKVYLDWLLSKDAQTTYSIASGGVSRRLDVPTDHIYDFQIPRPGVAYLDNYREPNVMIKDEMDAFLESAIPR